MLHEGNIGLDQACLNFVVTQAGTGIESTDILQRLQHGLHWAPDSFADFFVLFVLQAAQVLVHYRDRILQKLSCAVAVFMLSELGLMKAKLTQKALAQISCSHARRIELLNDL